VDADYSTDLRRGIGRPYEPTRTMSTYICHSCNIEIQITNRDSSGSVFANVCPQCNNDDELEYL